MPKRYFSNKKKKDPRLSYIIGLLLALVIIGYGGMQAYLWVTQNFFGAGMREQAPLTLSEAETKLNEGDIDGAREMLSPLIERLDDPILAPAAWMLMAKLETQAENPPAARSCYAEIISRFPASAAYPQAALSLAALLEAEQNFEEALNWYQRLEAEAAPEIRAKARVRLGRMAEQNDQLLEALEWYRKALEDTTWDSESWNLALDAYGRVNVALIFSLRETPETKYYVVQKGDSLNGIGVKLNTTQGLLILANGMDDPSKLRINQRLKYTPKDFRIVIERSTRRLFLMDSNGLFKRYNTGLGRPGHETTLGQYTIGNKQKDPTWFRPEGGTPVPPGDPDNELGTRWMPLVPAEEGLPSDLGIHGTIAPETIGTYASRGCPRMLKEEVEELYDLVVRSTPVTIVESMEPLQP